jgi:NAD(P)-dependent dehydrogenase (short-subunit alcohol dehydrogenase family)
MNDLTILITGASRGLGAAAARAAAQLRATLALTARTAGDLEAVAEDVRGAGGRALLLPGDVSRPEERVVAATLERFGGLDDLVVLAFYAPAEWSGSFLSWDAEQVQSLVRRYACSAVR